MLQEHITFFYIFINKLYFFFINLHCKPCLFEVIMCVIFIRLLFLLLILWFQMSVEVERKFLCSEDTLKILEKIGGLYSFNSNNYYIYFLFKKWFWKSINYLLDMESFPMLKDTNSCVTTVKQLICQL